MHLITSFSTRFTPKYTKNKQLNNKQYQTPHNQHNNRITIKTIQNAIFQLKQTSTHIRFKLNYVQKSNFSIISNKHLKISKYQAAHNQQKQYIISYKERKRGLHCLSIAAETRKTEKELIMNLEDPLEISGNSLKLNTKPPITSNSETVFTNHCIRISAPSQRTTIIIKHVISINCSRSNVVRLQRFGFT